MVNDGDFLFDNSHKRMTGNHIKACQHGRPFLTTRSVFVSIAVRINPKSAFPYPAVYLFEISAPSYQIDVALSNGVGF